MRWLAARLCAFERSPTSVGNTTSHKPLSKDCHYLRNNYLNNKKLHKNERERERTGERKREKKKLDEPGKPRALRQK